MMPGEKKTSLPAVGLSGGARGRAEEPLGLVASPPADLVGPSSATYWRNLT